MFVSPLVSSGRNGSQGHTERSLTGEAVERGTAWNFTGEERGCQAALSFFLAWLMTAEVGVGSCTVIRAGGLQGPFGPGAGLAEGIRLGATAVSGV